MGDEKMLKILILDEVPYGQVEEIETIPIHEEDGKRLSHIIVRGNTVNKI